MKIRILSAADVRNALPMAEAVAGMKEAYAQLSLGTAVVPLRGQMRLSQYGSTTLTMPAFLAESAAMAVKVVSVFPQNVAQGMPMIYGMVMVLEAGTGRPLALLEGAALTAIRTGAGGGAATDVLARPDAAVVAMLGSGVQARTLLEAVCTVRAIREVRLYSPTNAHAVAFAREMGGRGVIPPIRVVGDAGTAVRGADIVCAATTSSTPVFSGADLQPGTHVVGVGSYLPTMQEIDLETVRKALVVVDQREGALEEAGDLIIPLQQGAITEAHIHAELGEIIAGRKSGRTDNRQITFFKSVGNAAQDAIAGKIALENAIKLGIGQEVAL
jgi:ornithine cyclodeaminase/alanine dehydrogenase-like protein (mu-crystallin family)